jgi:hypothetical protein
MFIFPYAQDNIISTVLIQLERANLDVVPVVIRFLLQTCTSATIQELIPKIRNKLDFQSIAASLKESGTKDSTEALIIGKDYLL